MKLGFTTEQEAFRTEIAGWLEEQLSGPFADIRGVTSQTAVAERRLEWEQVLGASKWSAIGWPEKYGGRNADLAHHQPGDDMDHSPRRLATRPAPFQGEQRALQFDGST